MASNLKRALQVTGIASVALLTYEVISSIEAIKGLVNVRVLDRRPSCYIYIKHDPFREPVKDFLAEIGFREETLIYSFLHNIKRKLTFTKVRNNTSEDFTKITTVNIRHIFSLNML